MSIVAKVNEWFSLEFDEDFDNIAHPYKNREKRPKRKEAINANIQHVEDTEMKTILVEDNKEKKSLDWKVSKNIIDLQRNPLVTELDKEVILKYNLKIEKYKKIKAIWAKGKGIILISKDIKERGYSESVVKKYVKCINEANSSPLMPETGTASKGA